MTRELVPRRPVRKDRGADITSYAPRRWNSDLTLSRRHHTFPFDEHR